MSGTFDLLNIRVQLLKRKRARKRNRFEWIHSILSCMFILGSDKDQKTFRFHIYFRSYIIPPSQRCIEPKEMVTLTARVNERWLKGCIILAFFFSENCNIPQFLYGFLSDPGGGGGGRRALLSARSPQPLRIKFL